MKRTGYADLALHGGRAPPWLVGRMEKLASAILTVIVDEYGVSKVLTRLSDPLWFQALSCGLAYDWDSSGTTTVVCGVLKTVLAKNKLGLVAAGGKGKRSLQALDELKKIGETYGFAGDKVEGFQYASRMTAKVDNSAIQAGYRLYHHTMFVSNDGEWAVVQQGMNPESRTARRFHWLSSRVRSYVSEPHEGIVGNIVHPNVLDMTAKDSEGCRRMCTDLAQESPVKLQRIYQSIRLHDQESLAKWLPIKPGPDYVVHYRLHPENMNWDALRRLYEHKPRNYEEVLAQRGVGPSTVKGLALVSQLIYGETPSWKDPVKYSFAFGGKDGVPFPVRRREYDQAIGILMEAVEAAKLGDRDKLAALHRLRTYADKLGIGENA